MWPVVVKLRFLVVVRNGPGSALNRRCLGKIRQRIARNHQSKERRRRKQGTNRDPCSSVAKELPPKRHELPPILGDDFSGNLVGRLHLSSTVRKPVKPDRGPRSIRRSPDPPEVRDTQHVPEMSAFSSTRYPSADATAQDALNTAPRFCPLMNARWKSKFAGTINDR